MRSGLALVLAVALGAGAIGCAGRPIAPEPALTVADLDIPPALAGMAGELTELAERARPSMVQIRNEAQLLKPAGTYFSGLLDRLLGVLNPHPYWEWPYRVIGLPLYLLFGYFDLSVTRGSGFFVEDGLVMTNAHVVENSARIICELPDGRRGEAVVEALDRGLDLALLRVDLAGERPPSLRFRSHRPRPGEPVLAIGFPARETLRTARATSGEPTPANPRLTLGVISATEVELGNPRTRYVETDAALNPGNSGGPLLGLDGAVVGVTTLIAAGKENEGYAVPALAALAALRATLDLRAPPDEPPSPPAAPEQED